MRVVVSTEIDLPADQTWHLAADRFGETGDWTSQLTSSYLADDTVGEGATRVCRAGEKVREERITAYHPDQMRLTYTLLDPPSWVRSVANTWSVGSLDPQRSTLTMEVALDVAWYLRPATPLLRFGFRRLLRDVQEEFAHWAETGEPHPRKRKRSVDTAERRPPRASTSRERTER